MSTVSAKRMFVLAAIGVLTLGAGSAMAQSGTTIYPGAGFLPPQVITNGRPAAVGANRLQSGSSDVELNNARDPQDYRYQWGTLNNPG
jgi:hypothetical protein